jgi:plasmid stabilization system protein ParE
MTRKCDIHIQPEAESNMEEAYQWLLEKAPEYAADWFNNLVAEFRRLEVHPEKFPLAPENRFGVFDREVRQMLYGKGFWKYRILFFVEGDTVHIVHVRHGARRWLREGEGEE